MSGQSVSINHIAFLTPGNYPDSDPLSGFEKTQLRPVDAVAWRLVG
ncbi:hypothetical protein ACDY96_25120 [Rhizobium mongolense]